MEPQEEAFEYVMVDIEEESNQPAKFVSKISCNSLYGFTSAQTMKVSGYFKGKLLIILLDSRSTHNFMDPVVAKKNHSYIYP